MKWENCKKCPKELCDQRATLELSEFNVFEIKAPCAYKDNTFYTTITYKSNTFEDAINIALNSNLSLEKALQLSKLKNEFTSLSSKQSQS